jgi:hypothetical protein
MALKREVSLGMALATGALVWGIYNTALPPVVDVRVGDPGDKDADAAERTATWFAAAVVSGISLIAKDGTIFVVGSAMIIGMSVWHRHSNQYSATMGSATMPSSRAIMNEANAEAAGYTPVG